MKRRNFLAALAALFAWRKAKPKGQEPRRGWHISTEYRVIRGNHVRVDTRTETTFTVMTPDDFEQATKV